MSGVWKRELSSTASGARSVDQQEGRWLWWSYEQYSTRYSSGLYLWHVQPRLEEVVGHEQDQDRQRYDGHLSRLRQHMGN